MRARRRLHLKVAGAMLGLVVALACAEAWFRFVSPTRWRRPIAADASTDWSDLVHRPSALEGLQYELNPGADAVTKGIRVQVDSLGLRGPEIALAKPPGTFRVAAIGDSVTFGFNVSAEDAWPAALERDLGERTSARVEVLNFGVGGYSTRDCAVVLGAKALALSPDLVVYAYFLNDPETEPLQPLQQFFAPVAWWQHSAFLRRIDQFVHERRVRVFGGGDAYRALHATDGPSWPSVLAALDSMKATSAQAHVPVLVAIFPNFQGRATWSEYPYRDLHEQVARAAAERGFGVLDLEPVFRDSGRTPVDLGSDDDHPSVEGNRLAAHAIGDWIASAPGWPPKSSR
jgi:lysophospholipase L1-like esterase